MTEINKHYTDEEIANDNSLVRDIDGVWVIGENGTRNLVEPSKEWFEKYRTPVSTTEPTQEERIAALEQALLNLLG